MGDEFWDGPGPLHSHQWPFGLERERIEARAWGCLMSAAINRPTQGKAPAPSKVPGASGEQLSFLPPPPFCPTWPTRGTLADIALGMLMDGRMIDHPEFESSTQSWRLGAVVFTLRTLGWPVETIEIPSPTQQCPDRIIALYRLDAKYTAQALAMNARPA